MSVKLFPQLSHKVIGACFNVHNSLGPGLPENVYHKALEFELKDLGILFHSQAYFPVRYKGNLAGEFFADMVVEGKIILELKSVILLKEIFRAQLLNYLRLSNIRVGYLVNFHNEKVEFERFVV